MDKNLIGQGKYQYSFDIFSVVQHRSYSNCFFWDITWYNDHESSFRLVDRCVWMARSFYGLRNYFSRFRLSDVRHVVAAARGRERTKTPFFIARPYFLSQLWEYGNF